MQVGKSGDGLREGREGGREGGNERGRVSVRNEMSMK